MNHIGLSLLQGGSKLVQFVHPGMRRFGTSHTGPVRKTSDNEYPMKFHRLYWNLKKIMIY